VEAAHNAHIASQAGAFCRGAATNPHCREMRIGASQPQCSSEFFLKTVAAYNVALVVIERRQKAKP
jgi:hypothetical protein